MHVYVYVYVPLLPPSHSHGNCAQYTTVVLSVNPTNLFICTSMHAHVQETRDDAEENATSPLNLPSPPHTSNHDDDDCLPPSGAETPPHTRTTRAQPPAHTAAGTATPTAADTGNTVPPATPQTASVALALIDREPEPTGSRFSTILDGG